MRRRTERRAECARSPTLAAPCVPPHGLAAPRGLCYSTGGGRNATQCTIVSGIKFDHRITLIDVDTLLTAMFSLYITNAFVRRVIAWRCNSSFENLKFEQAVVVVSDAERETGIAAAQSSSARPERLHSRRRRGCLCWVQGRSPCIGTSFVPPTLVCCAPAADADANIAPENMSVGQDERSRLRQI